MIGFVVGLLLAAAPAPEVARGSKVFAERCAVGYCHGSGGTANRGPRLAGRGLDGAYLERVIRNGIPGKTMPPWTGTLPEADLRAVIAYVVGISGGAARGGSSSPMPSSERAPEWPPQVKRGKALFFDPDRDPVRGVRCGTCHAVDGWGTPVGPNLLATPVASAAALRALPAPNVAGLRTREGESFPALPVQQTADVVKVYDLTAPPPVLRTLRPADVTWTGAASWSHADAIRGYSDQELARIVDYLRWLAAHS
jgi:mono/diheme cytochrome c family protein